VKRGVRGGLVIEMGHLRGGGIRGVLSSGLAEDIRLVNCAVKKKPSVLFLKKKFRNASEKKSLRTTRNKEGSPRWKILGGQPRKNIKRGRHGERQCANRKQQHHLNGDWKS